MNFVRYRCFSVVGRLTVARYSTSIGGAARRAFYFFFDFPDTTLNHLRRRRFVGLFPSFSHLSFFLAAAAFGITSAGLASGNLLKISGRVLDLGQPGHPRSARGCSAETRIRARVSLHFFRPTQLPKVGFAAR